MFYGKRRMWVHIYSIVQLSSDSWAFSVDFARAILQEYHCRLENALFDFDALANARILELGYVHSPLVSSS